MNGYKIAPGDFISEKDKVKPYAINPSLIGAVGKYDLTSPDIQENSVAVIPVQGVLTGWKSMELEQFIKQADANPNIISKLFLVNSPGGMVFYTDILGNTNANSEKPSVSYVLQMAASAAMWFVANTDKIIASSPLDQFGSIGVMTTYMDFTKLLSEKLGITKEDFYARLSTNKNEISRLLQDLTLTPEERTGPLLDQLDYINEMFHSVIRDQLDIAADSEVFSGKMYYAPKAIELGLAHSIGTFENALQTAYNMGIVNSIKTYGNKF